MRLPLFLALASVAGCVAPPTTGELAQPIINGTDDTADPAVMLLVAQPQGSMRAGLCTATLVSPHLLLTAAHCVDPAIFATDMGTPMKVNYYVDTSSSVNLSQPIDPSTLLPVQTVMWDQQFNPDPAVFFGTGHDIGAVVLASPQTVTPVPYNKTALASSTVGQQARIIGYGVTSGTDTTGSTAGTKRQTNIAITTETNLYVEFQDGSHGICEGDSGGPALLMLNGVETIVGTTAFGANGCPLTQPSYDTRTDTYASEIDGWVTMAENGTAGGGSGGTGGGGGTGGSGGTGGTGGSSGSDGGTGGNGAMMGNGKSSGCSVSPGAASSPLAALLLVFGACALLARRRRSHS